MESSYLIGGCCVVFFFQAEDGIRDLVRSRGLGDVYKRQRLDRGDWLAPQEIVRIDVAHVLELRVACEDVADVRNGLHPQAGSLDTLEHRTVSYTHLTLPTIYSV